MEHVMDLTLKHQGPLYKFFSTSALILPEDNYLTEMEKRWIAQSLHRFKKFFLDVQSEKKQKNVLILKGTARLKICEIVVNTVRNWCALFAYEDEKGNKIEVDLCKNAEDITELLTKQIFI